jgi:hypothetical protein
MPSLDDGGPEARLRSILRLAGPFVLSMHSPGDGELEAVTLTRLPDSQPRPLRVRCYVL